MRSGVHGGARSAPSSTVSTSGEFARVVGPRCPPGSSGRPDKPIEVRLWVTLTFRSSTSSVVDEPEVDDIHPQLRILDLAERLEASFASWHAEPSLAAGLRAAATGSLNRRKEAKMRQIALFALAWPSLSFT